VLRLVSPRPRAFDYVGDLSRFDRAYGQLAKLAGPGEASAAQAETSFALVHGDHVFLRRGPGVGPKLEEGTDVTEWAPPTGLSMQFTYWRSNPFSRESPELVAGRLVLLSFKRRFLALRPPGNELISLREDSLAFAQDRSRLPAQLLEYVHQVATARHEYLGSTALLGTTVDSMVGHPRVVVQVGSRDAQYACSWGETEASVIVLDEEPDNTGSPLRELVVDPALVAHRDLRRELEQRLGSTMETQAVRRPSPFGWMP